MAAIAPTVALYRALVPAHGAVDDAVITVWLDQAVEAHTKSTFGDRYDAAMVWWAAHHIHKTPGTKGNARAAADEVGAVSSQSDSMSTTDGVSSTLSRSYNTATSPTAVEDDFRTSIYGQQYIAIVKSRAARAPFFVRL